MVGRSDGQQRESKHKGLAWLVLAFALLLSGCQSTPRVSPGRDGPEAYPPAATELLATPNPLPRLEPIRVGGPNKPYDVLGEHYVPLQGDEAFSERGLASWYGNKFHGRPTASGEVYNMYAMTAAHPTLPIPSYARVRNPANGREVVVRVNDRGPFHKGRIVDLSYTAALKLDLLRGVAPVELTRITQAEIRAGFTPPPEPPPVFAPAEPANAPPRDTTETLRPPPETSPARTEAARGFWVQLGAFKRLDAAEALRSQLAEQDLARVPLLTIVRENGLHKLQAGPYATREDALGQWQGGVLLEKK
jgi:rare lipoprotein A